MTSTKLIDLFLKEKTRVTQEIFNPIIDVINNPKYDVFFNTYFTAYINLNIVLNKMDLNLLADTNLQSHLANKQYLDLYDKTIDKFLSTGNFSPLKLVFGEQNYKPWALCLLKFILFSYFENKHLTNIQNEIFEPDFDYTIFFNNNDFDNIIFAIYKILFGVNSTSIYTLEYWQKLTKFKEKQYNLFKKVVISNNPTISLINAFHLYHLNTKSEFYKKLSFHEFKSFDPAPTLSIKDPVFAKNWIINYLACISLNNKIQIGLWKAIQNLVFGVQKGKTTVMTRTVSEIDINIRSVWALDPESQKLFNYLKLQSIFKEPLPPTFEDFIKQDPIKLRNTLQAKVNKFKNLYKKLAE